jgi:hypothetical protein
VSVCSDCKGYGYVSEITTWCSQNIDYMSVIKTCESCAFDISNVGSSTVCFVIFLDYGGVSRVWDGSSWKSSCGKQFASYMLAKTYANENLTKLLKHSNITKQYIIIKECEISTTGKKYFI